MFNLPNILTLSRLAFLPVILILIGIENTYGALATWLAFQLYVLCALTDFLDGYIARKYNQVSAFGTFLDPVSDKIFVGILLVALIGLGRLEGLWMIPVLLILTREFLISGLREFLGPKDVKVPVTQLAKWKTTFQMAALGLLIAAPVLSFIPHALLVGQITLSLAALITLITGWGYLKAAKNHLA